MILIMNIPQLQLLILGEFLQLFFFFFQLIPCMLCVALWESSASHARSSPRLNFFKVDANGNRGAALVLFPLANLFIALNQHVLLLFSRVSLLSMRSSSVLMCSRLTPWLSLLNNAGGAGTRWVSAEDQLGLGRVAAAAVAALEAEAGGAWTPKKMHACGQTCRNDRERKDRGHNRIRGWREWLGELSGCKKEEAQRCSNSLRLLGDEMHNRCRLKHVSQWTQLIL